MRRRRGSLVRKRVFYTPTALPLSLVGGGLCRAAMAVGTMLRAGSVALPRTLMYSHPPCNKYTHTQTNIHTKLLTFTSMHVQDNLLWSYSGNGFIKINLQCIQIQISKGPYRRYIYDSPSTPKGKKTS